MIAARRAADEERLVVRCGLFDIAPKAGGGGAVARQHTLSPVARLAQQFLRHQQLELELLVAAAQLLLQRADGEVSPDARQHLLGLERLVHEIDGAELESAHLGQQFPRRLFVSEFAQAMTAVMKSYFG